jgi:hypothetical protein
MTSGETPHVSSEPLLKDGDFDNLLDLKFAHALVPGYADSLALKVDNAEADGIEHASIEIAPMYDFECMNVYVARMQVGHMFQDLGFSVEEYYNPPEEYGNGAYGLSVFWSQEAEAKKPKPHVPADVQSSISPLSHPREGYVAPETEPNPVEMIISDGSPESGAPKGLVFGRDKITGRAVFAQG